MISNICKICGEKLIASKPMIFNSQWEIIYYCNSNGLVHYKLVFAKSKENILLFQNIKQLMFEQIFFNFGNITITNFLNKCMINNDQISSSIDNLYIDNEEKLQIYLLLNDF